MINTCTKFEFNPSTSWGSYARHRHNLLHGARSTTDIKPWHKHTTGELKIHELTKILLIHLILNNAWDLKTLPQQLTANLGLVSLTLGPTVIKGRV